MFLYRLELFGSIFCVVGDELRNINEDIKVVFKNFQSNNIYPTVDQFIFELENLGYIQCISEKKINLTALEYEIYHEFEEEKECLKKY